MTINLRNLNELKGNRTKTLEDESRYQSSIKKGSMSYSIMNP